MKTITYDETKWKLVPVEPTEEMLDAAGDECQYRKSAHTVSEDRWAAMLAAAPAAPEAPQPSQQDIPRNAIEKILTEVMDAAVANGADSRSMPDEYVEVAAWLCGIKPSHQSSQVLTTTQIMALDYRGSNKDEALRFARTVEREVLRAITAQPSQQAEPVACWHPHTVTQFTGDGTPVEYCPECDRNVEINMFPIITPPSEDARDAARYRWLRDIGDKHWLSFQKQWFQSANGCDEAVDRAMQKGGCNHNCNQGRNCTCK